MALIASGCSLLEEPARPVIPTPGPTPQSLQEVLARMPDYEVQPGGVERVHSSNVRGFAALPLEFTA